MEHLEQAFEKLIGRQPSELEVTRLYRVKNALGLRDNDALWLVLIALESYDTLYRKYPELINAHVKQSLDDQRQLMAAMADAETKRALGAMSDAVVRASEAATARAGLGLWFQWWGFAMLGLLLFGAFCTMMGFILGSGHMPYWTRPSGNHGFAVLLFTTIGRTPAGWLAVIIGATSAIAGFWYARDELKLHHRLGILSRSFLLAALGFAFVWPLL
ncbi:hypothetical protein HF313_23045 [Massilia atriviolacea]|uniref:Uncharacterized protein n=1 Tax=Massilia atriviolacea TaxID=2495579 RepID=A0A430HCB2_9BURK|nr:hypothetical protein [Massilia atriviolacea]RSZ55160.1 hypothetical protein EJB06_30845 [Massilia atriviolacea]